MKLTRVGTTPVLEPRKDVPWESGAVLNAAATHADGKFHLFYRAVSHVPERNRSCIGHAWSDDGVNFERANEPILKNGETPEEEFGVEDPRITLIDGTYHLTYASYGPKGTVISRASSTDLASWTRHGVMMGYDQFGRNKNATLFPEKIDGRYALIHRPMGDRWRTPHPHEMWMSFSDDLADWRDHRLLMHCRRHEVEWEHVKIGLGATPFRTGAGWLMIYHAVDRDSRYALGLALLDLDDPLVTIKRSAEPILAPETGWEVEGDVKNVVFTCGAVLLGHELWVYYGGADTVIGLAKGDVREFIDA